MEFLYDSVYLNTLTIVDLERNLVVRREER